MLVNNNNETILNQYIDYLKDKGKIIRIKDISKEINIRFSNGIIFYFLLIVSIALVVLNIYLISSNFISSNTYGENNFIIVIGVALFTAILIGVTFYEKKGIKMNITYPNENQIKVNNKIFDIEKEDLYIDINNNYEYNLRFAPKGMYSPGYYTIKYFLTITGNKSSKSFQITNGTEEQLGDLIYNFEYEISDFKNKKSEALKNMNEVLEELYDKGSVSQETFDKFKKKIDE